MTLKEIREAYEKNYQEILTVILEMGGEGNIVYHKKKNTPEYQKLRQLQRTEHWLTKMEEMVAEEV
jgi:hypothetical protein